MTCTTIPSRRPCATCALARSWCRLCVRHGHAAILRGLATQAVRGAVAAVGLVLLVGCAQPGTYAGPPMDSHDRALVTAAFLSRGWAPPTPNPFAGTMGFRPAFTCTHFGAFSTCQ